MLCLGNLMVEFDPIVILNWLNLSSGCSVYLGETACDVLAEGFHALED
jgi:hypothetical protein